NALLKPTRNLLHIRPRRPQNRPALVQNPRRRLQRQRHRDIIQNPSPPLHEPDKLIAMVQNPFAYRRPNHSIQSRAVSAARQHSNPHHSLLLNFLASEKSYATAGPFPPAPQQ